MFRDEHQNPQFERTSVRCLNGRWEFEKGLIAGKENSPLSGAIEVPFCPESVLSGIGDRTYITDCIYSRTVEISGEEMRGRLLLHFGAVDYIAVVYVNGVKVTEHVGGYTAFYADIAPFVHEGPNRITVAVHDDVRENIPSGKQSKAQNSQGCFYCRSTGIWQTVWLESVPNEYLKSVKYYPQRDYKTVKVEIATEGCGNVQIDVKYDGKIVGRAQGLVEYRAVFDIELAQTHLWEIGKGELYDVELTFGQDKVASYFGFRIVEYSGKKFTLNGKSVFQRLVLDQGYYEDGIYTAKDVSRFKQDIDLSMSLGFNGARLHQKVFEQRYLYECDKAGYLVWGEFPSWGLKYDDVKSLGVFVSQWTEVIEQYFNHPSIITWCPLNEVWEDLENVKRIRDVRFVETAYLLTKTLDSTRPCIDASGGYHGKFTDVFDFHNYHLSDKTCGFIDDIVNKRILSMDKTYAPPFANENILYDGKLPLLASECGGVAFFADDKGWGYHAVASEEDFVKEYVATTKLYLSCADISGFCYTQLYDVEQEQNGLFTYLRKNKFSIESLNKIADSNRTVAAIEK